MDEKKNIEIVSGDGSSLDISPVYEHIDAGKPKQTKKPSHIVVPDGQKKEKKMKSKRDKEKKE